MLFQAPPPPPPQKPITVWVHGTRGMSFLPLSIWVKAKQVEEEICFAPPGLHRALDVQPQFYQHTIAHILAATNSNRFPLDAFYLFGWSGDLNPEARFQAAQVLYEQLAHLAQMYEQQYHCPPSITIITHSHGGNVVLNLASLFDQCTFKLIIECFIPLACPVQAETEKFVTHPMFKKVYSLHSHADLIQSADPQKLHPFKTAIKQAWEIKKFTPLKEAFKTSAKRPLFSKRHFPPHHHLVQAHIKWQTIKPWNEEDIHIFSHFRPFLRTTFGTLNSKRSLLHIEFLLPSFLKQLSHILIILDDQKYTNTKQELVISL